MACMLVVVEDELTSSVRPRFFVRPMREQDLVRVSVLAGQLVRLHYAWDSLRFLLPSAPEEGYARFFKSELENPAAVLLVAEPADGTVLGYAYARMEPVDYQSLLGPCGKLHDIFIDPSARRLGVGKSLLRAAVAALAERGAPRVVLATAVQNEAAQSLFVAAGFRPTMIELTLELGAERER